MPPSGSSPPGLAGCPGEGTYGPEEEWRMAPGGGGGRKELEFERRKRRTSELRRDESRTTGFRALSMRAGVT